MAKKIKFSIKYKVNTHNNKAKKIDQSQEKGI